MKKLDLSNNKEVFYNLGTNVSGSSEFGGSTLNNVAEGKTWATCYSQLVNYFRTAQEIKNNKQVIVDAGCGQAELLTVIRGNRKSNRYIGIELNDKNIEKCKHKFKKPEREVLIKYDLTVGIPLEDNISDITVCALVLEHVSKEQAFKMFKELIRVTKENGIIQILVPLRKDGEDNEQKEHIYEWHDYDIKELLETYKEVFLVDKYFGNARIKDINKTKYKEIYKLLKGKVHPVFIRAVLSPLVDSGRDLYLKFQKKCKGKLW